MSAHLQREIENLKKEILTVGAMVEQSLREAILAVQRRSEALARSVIEKDIKIDRMEVEVEESCLKTLALHQPVAIDLRFIITVLKINNDLERVGDLAVNIAERALFLATQPQVDVEFDFTTMAVKTQGIPECETPRRLDQNSSRLSLRHSSQPSQQSPNERGLHNCICESFTFIESMA